MNIYGADALAIRESERILLPETGREKLPETGSLPSAGKGFGTPFVKSELFATEGDKTAADNLERSGYDIRDVSGTDTKDRDANKCLWEGALCQTDEDALLLVENSLTEEATEELDAEGEILAEYTEEALARALLRIKEGHELFEARTEKFTDRIRNERENVLRMAEKNITDSSPRAKLRAQLLETADFPVTDTVVSNVYDALESFETAVSRESDAARYIVKNELPPTIENLYRAAFAGTIKSRTVSGQVFEAMQPAIEKLIDDAGLEISEETLSEAKSLLEADIPVTAKTLTKLNETNEILSLSTGEVTEQLAYGLPYESNPCKIELEATYREAKVLRTRFEASLTLSLKSANTLIKNGLSAELSTLSETTEKLRELENRYYRRLLDENGYTPVSEKDAEERVSLLREVSEKISSLSLAPADILAVTYTSRFTITAGELCDHAEKLSVSAKYAEASYEKLITSPRADMGDSISKAFDNIPALLSEISEEPTDVNIRAAKILGRNGMEISSESITQMKFYDSRVTGMIKAMTPGVVAKMVKNGFNPLLKTVDEVMDEASRLGAASEEADDEKYSAFLVRMERNGQLSASEREAYIGIYRLLHQISSGDTACLGAVIKSGEELTLRNLLKETRTRKAHGINKTVDDNSETVSGGYRFNIETQISSYYLQLSKSLYREITPEKLSYGETNLEYGLLDSELELLADSFGRLPDEISAAEENEKYYELQEEAERVKAAFSEYRSEGEFLRSVSLPDNTLFREAMHNLLNSTDFFRTLGKKSASDFTAPDYGPFSTDSTDNTPDSLETLTDYYSELIQSAKTIIEAKSESVLLSAEDFSLLRTVSTGLTFRSRLADRGFFEIPVNINGEAGRIKLHLKNAGENELPGLSVSVEAEDRSLVSISLTVTEGGISLNTDRARSEAAVGFSEEFTEALSELFKDSPEAVSSETLYTAARQIVNEIYRQLKKQ